jgi:hypothetical protein
MLVSESRRRQIMCLHLDPPRVSTLQCLFLLTNELGKGWLLTDRPGPMKKRDSGTGGDCVEQLREW